MILISHYPAAPAPQTQPLTLAFPIRLLLAERSSVTATFGVTLAEPVAICIRATAVTAVMKPSPGWRHYGINE